MDIMKKKRAWIALLICAVMLSTLGCATAATADTSTGTSYDVSYAESSAMEEAAYDGYAMSDSAESTASVTSQTNTAGDFDVRKIVYNAYMTITADDPGKTLNDLIAKTEELGGYVSDSYTTTDDDGAYLSTATLKVPADQLDALVTVAEAAGKVEDYRLSSDDISLSYYDMQARLDNAKAEEQQLLEILAQCETVEDILAVRQSLTEVRADIESYTAQMNLWDNLVAYATLDVTINRTPKTVVEGEKELIQIWKASDVWNKMARGFNNSARFIVNAIGAIGIFLAVAIIPAGILFLAIGLPIILHKRKKRKKIEELRRAQQSAPGPDDTTKLNE